VIDQIDRRVADIWASGGRVRFIDKLDEVGKNPVTGRRINGRIWTYRDGTAEIYLYKGANEATMVEELYHYKQLADKGMLGKQSSLSELTREILETEAAQYVLDLSFRFAKP
jgi:hypothetical protein